jgi:hypothetical protein
MGVRWTGRRDADSRGDRHVLDADIMRLAGAPGSGRTQRNSFDRGSRFGL